jgi:hypothetical protein
VNYPERLRQNLYPFQLELFEDSKVTEYNMPVWLNVFTRM